MKVKIREFFNNKMVDPYTYHGDEGSVLHFLIEKNKYKIFEKVLKNQPHFNLLIGESIINLTNKEKQTPLMIALAKQELKFVDLLSKYEANWLISDQEGKDSFHYKEMFEDSPDCLNNLILVKKNSNNKLGLIFTKHNVTSESIQKIIDYCERNNLKVSFIKIYSKNNSFDYNLLKEIKLYFGEKESVGRDLYFERYLGKF